MPKVKTTLPVPDKHKGQRSIDVSDLPLYINRIIPAFGNPIWWTAELWREMVRRQPIAMICREFLIANLINLDWKIEPRDSTQRDELKEDIKYYEKFFNNTGDYDWVELLELIAQDLLDTPFGGCLEVGRDGDSPDGKVLWVEPLDAATLFPTYNFDWPVGQYVRDYSYVYHYFPKHAVNRVFMSPRSELKRKGWGMPPPEKIYLGLELLNRGDTYYANLLLDTPEVGILDLGDMAEDSAKRWLQSWQTMLKGIDPFKIPVLYEHTTKVDFVQFQRSPTELMFDKATYKYGAIIASGYGMTLSDLGFPSNDSGGSTLAGSIRSERGTRRTGYGRIKKKTKLFMDRMLPDDLEFKWIDLDDEISVAIGRARLANATAFGQLIDKQVVTPEEARLQTIADGLISISIPEKIPESDLKPMLSPINPMQNGKSPERPNEIGRPVSPSQGGWGEVKSQITYSNLVKWLGSEDMKQAIFEDVRPKDEITFRADLSEVGIEYDNYVTLCGWLSDALADTMNGFVQPFIDQNLSVEGLIEDELFLNEMMLACLDDYDQFELALLNKISSTIDAEVKNEQTEKTTIRTGDESNE